MGFTQWVELSNFETQSEPVTPFGAHGIVAGTICLRRVVCDGSELLELPMKVSWREEVE
jgi:hypothetical protein